MSTPMAVVSVLVVIVGIIFLILYTYFKAIAEEVVPPEIPDPVEEELTPDISEPVQTILKLFEENKEDFNVVHEKYDSYLNNSRECTVTHKPSGIYGTIEYRYSKNDSDTIYKSDRYGNHCFIIELQDVTLTEDERLALISAFFPYYRDNIEARKARIEDKKRKRVTDKLLAGKN